MYQSLLETSWTCAAGVVAVLLGVAGMGLAATGADTADVCARPRCIDISLAPSTRMNHNARSIGMGAGGVGGPAPLEEPVMVELPLAIRLGSCGGENMVSNSSTPLNPCGTDVSIRRDKGMFGLARSARN